MVELASEQRRQKLTLKVNYGDLQAAHVSMARQVRLTSSGQKPICCSITSTNVPAASIA
jgi:hypothetical protein